MSAQTRVLAEMGVVEAAAGRVREMGVWEEKEVVVVRVVC
jgi:hypothetical protein